MGQLSTPEAGQATTALDIAENVLEIEREYRGGPTEGWYTNQLKANITIGMIRSHILDTGQTIESIVSQISERGRESLKYLLDNSRWDYRDLTSSAADYVPEEYKVFFEQDDQETVEFGKELRSLLS